MNRLIFYWLYAARNLWRNRRWSAFAVFSVAAGVATVVALRSLGLGIADSLTDNLRSSNKGDITISIGSDNPFGAIFGSGTRQTFNRGSVDGLRRYAEQSGVAMAEYIVDAGGQVTAIDGTRAGRPQFVSLYYIDPATYPPTRDIFALDPRGMPLSELLTGGSNEIVISRNLADNENIRVGDTVRVSGTEEVFTVRGIVPTETEAGLRQIFSAFFGFAYLHQDRVGAVIPIDPLPNRISFLLPGEPDDQAIFDNVQQIMAVLRNQGQMARFDIVPDLLRQNEQIADILGRFIVIMSLGALLIGGIGIINTMLVVVRRRTNEVAALKTFGLKGRQVAALFMAEALLIGAIGSLLGGVIGVLLSGFANSFGEVLIQQPVRWRIYPEAIGYGVIVGTIISAVFGVLPVLTAARIRPAIILRPNETHIPVAGCFTSLLAVGLVVLVMGAIAGQIVGSFLFGVLLVATTLLLLALLVWVMWLVVWLVGKAPAFGNINLRLALRNLSTARLRTSTTLLALSAGMFALSSIAFFGAGVREILNFTLSESLGGNVLIFPILPPQVAQPLIDNQLDRLEGVEYRTRLLSYTVEVTGVNGMTVDEVIGIDVSALQAELQEARQRGDFERMSELSLQLGNVFSRFVPAIVLDTTNPNPSRAELIAGRNLTAADRGQAVAVVAYSERMALWGVEIGTRLTLSVGSETVEVEVVGIQPELDATNIQTQALRGEITLPGGVIRQLPGFQLNLAQVRADELNNVLLQLSSVPLIFALDISFFDGVLSRFIAQFSALPLLVGILSLGAAAVIMANTVALATLERRRQIGILKAIGLKSQRVLNIMILENVLVTLLGGLLGIGLSALGVWIMTTFGLAEAIFIPPSAVPIAFLLVFVAVGIGLIATFLSAGVAVRERVLNVLRYE